jgi:hypothetical protein
MKRSPRFLVVLVFVLCPVMGSAQDQVLTHEQEAFAQGTHVTRRLLHELHFSPLYGKEDLDQDPAHTLLVVLGKLDELKAIDRMGGGGYLDRFLERGGAVLIASDYPPDPPLNQIVYRLGGVKMLEASTRVNTSNPEDAYKSFLDCPFVLPQDGREADAIFGAGDRRLMHVATNQPSALWHLQQWPQIVPILARYPDSCATSCDAGRVPATVPLFAVGGRWEKGKVLILADQSVLVNMMMLPRDNDNVAFALNAFTWLREGPNGPRSQALFVEDGLVNPVFEVPLKMPRNLPLPEIKPEDLPLIVAQGDAILAGLEDDNAIDPAVKDLTTPYASRPRVWAYVCAVCSILVLSLVSYRVMRSGRHSLESSLPTLDRAVEQLIPEKPLLTLRHRAILRSGNFWEPASALARDAFTRAGVVVSATRTMPRFVARGGFWERRRLCHWVRNLWQLAYGPPRAVDASVWDRLPDELERLTALLRSGDIAARPGV